MLTETATPTEFSQSTWQKTKTSASQRQRKFRTWCEGEGNLDTLITMHATPLEKLKQ